MSIDYIQKKLAAEIEQKPRMGLVGIFSFLTNELFKSVDETKAYMIQILGYKTWMVNKSHYAKMYHQNYYQQRKLNKPEIDKRN